MQIKQYVTEVISFAFNLYDFVFFIFYTQSPFFRDLNVTGQFT